MVSRKLETAGLYKERFQGIPTFTLKKKEDA